MRMSAKRRGQASSGRPAGFGNRFGSIVAGSRVCLVVRRATLNRRAAAFVAAALLIPVAYELATLTGVIVPAPQQTVANVSPPEPTGESVSVRASLKEGSRAQPLGHAAVEAAAPPVRLPPETRANLKVTGTLVSADAGRAIIASASAPEKTYELGEAVDGSGGAILRAVHADGVVLARGDRSETLPLARRSVSAPSVADAQATLGPAAPAVAVPPGPPVMTDVVRVAPFYANGELAGFRVSPGVEREGFAALGFQRGDVVTEIGGQKLDDTRRAQQFFAALERGSIVQATVLRNGLPRSLVIDPRRVVFRGPETGE